MGTIDEGELRRGLTELGDVLRAEDVRRVSATEENARLRELVKPLFLELHRRGLTRVVITRDAAQCNFSME